MPELVCSLHGPYDATLGSCPYCDRGRRSSGQNPPMPRPLDDDDAPTDPRGAAYLGDDLDDAPTDLGRGARGAGSVADDETALPRRRPTPADDDEGEGGTVIERPQKVGALAWLIVKSGGRYGKIYQVKPNALIGRDIHKADMVLDDEKVSSLHAKFMLKEGAFVLYDLGSSNGTFVNGVEVNGAQPVRENDEIKMGNLVFVLKTLGA